jgi:hypothetical protein
MLLKLYDKFIALVEHDYTLPGLLALAVIMYIAKPFIVGV